VATSVVKCGWVKCSEVISNSVSNIIRRSHGVCCLHGFFVYHILSCPFGSIFLITVCTVVMFCGILFNSVNCVFLLLCLCILIVMYALFCIFCIFIVPTGTLRLPSLRVFRAFSSAVRQMPGYNWQRRGTVPYVPS